MDNPFRTAFDVWSDAREPLRRHFPLTDIEATEELIADRSDAATPRIMVFGTYNAGKSTLINALIGRDVARVADHPETDRVTSYPWRGFMLDDTPGIDAPIEHEKVTRKHLETVDAVLFVLATDGTLEEQRSFDEIVQIVRDGKPVRVILNNKSGLEPYSAGLLELRDRVADNLRLAAATAGIEDIGTLVPIRIINAASGLRGRREGKQTLLASSFLPELEDDIFELCKASGKAQRAYTVCRRMAKQIDLALAGLPTDEGTQPIFETTSTVAAERTRLTAVLDHAAQEAAAVFQSALEHAVSSGQPSLGQAAAEEAAGAVSSVIERELRKTQRVFGDIESAFTKPAAAIRPVRPERIPLPGGDAPESPDKGFDFKFSDAAELLSPVLNQINQAKIVGGLMAAKQVFPAAFKGLGPSFFGRVAPFIGPSIQALTGIHDAAKAYRESEREFDREKNRRLATAQQIADAGRKMRWALSQQCLSLIESVFGPVEDVLALQIATFKGKSAIIVADRVMLLQCRGRLEIALEG